MLLKKQGSVSEALALFVQSCIFRLNGKMSISWNVQN